MSEPLSPTPSKSRLPWITPALLALTVRIWSKRYGRPIDAAEATSILVGTGQLVDVLKMPLAARGRAAG